MNTVCPPDYPVPLCTETIEGHCMDTVRFALEQDWSIARLRELFLQCDEEQIPRDIRNTWLDAYRLMLDLRREGRL